ncbi:MAG TPA: methyltransferase domain-containing protein [Acidimicrobiales bacterium]|nr:methyltransferase domain-containing protein [Acidimicrobiales bacterium]
MHASALAEEHVPTRSNPTTSEAVLGDRLRAADPADPQNGVLVALAAGQPADRDALARVLGPDLVSGLIASRTLRSRSEGLHLDYALGLTNDVIFVAPDPDPAPGESRRVDDLLYLGPDSAFLVEAALSLAPVGERAVDLGAGTGLLAAVLVRRYATVVATDLVPRVAGAARLTLALNARPDGHRAGAVVADVAGGLRRRSFDLVTANAPWVPIAAGPDARHRVFADGGSTGVELPLRFIREGAELLCPGGVAIVLALDVLCDDGRRPIRDACADLSAHGFTTVLVPTPMPLILPDLPQRVCARQPRLVDAEHVAVVVAAPSPSGGPRYRVLVAAEALARRWAARSESA